jgi:DNA-binding transcriptional MerR regulator
MAFMKTLLLTLPELSRRSTVSQPTLKLYADSGLLECSYDSRGCRLFGEKAIGEARRLRDERTGRRSEAADAA